MQSSLIRARSNADLGHATKRISDILISLVLILLFAPLMLFSVLLVILSSPGPLFYMQKRVGRNGEAFSIIKFRTMTVGADKCGPSVTSADDVRITPVGRFMRRTKLDELPQLFNVLRGDMSLVGPRPQVPRFVDEFHSDLKDVVLSVPPGVTGITALCFRNEEKMLEQIDDRERYYIDHIMPVKLKLDAWYVRNRRLSADLFLLAATACLLSYPPLRSMFVRTGGDFGERMANGILGRYLAFCGGNDFPDVVLPGAFSPTELTWSSSDDRSAASGAVVRVGGGD